MERTSNLVKLFSWRCYNDEYGSSYKILNQIEDPKNLHNDDGEIAVRLIQGKSSKRHSCWVCLLFNINVVDEYHDINKCKTIEMNYKCDSDFSPQIRFNENEVVKLPNCKEYKKINIELDKLRNKTKEKEFSKLVFNFEIPFEGGEATLYIKELYFKGYSVLCNGKFEELGYCTLKPNLLATYQFYRNYPDKIFLRFASNFLCYKFPKIYDWANKKAWNRLYKDGNILTGLKDMKEYNEVVDVIEKNLTQNGKVLDLGCGVGQAGRSISSEKLSTYTGVDISSVAIEKAKNFYDNNKKYQFHSSDIKIFKPKHNYDVIIFNEVIYYFVIEEIRELLLYYMDFLNIGGAIVIKIYDKFKYQELIKEIKDLGYKNTIFEYDDIVDLENVILLLLEKNDN